MFKIATESKNGGFFKLWSNYVFAALGLVLRNIKQDGVLPATR